MVPVVVDPGHGDHRGEQQRQGDDAELGDVPSPVERPDLAGQVPGQESQPGERPCGSTVLSGGGGRRQASKQADEMKMASVE